MINYDFTIKYIFKKNNMRINAFNKKSNYKIYLKSIKSLLKKNKNKIRFMKIIEN